jgi:hypothetical protein
VRNDLERLLTGLSEILPTRAFVVESDSDDDTVVKLTQMSTEDSRVRFVTLGNLSSSMPDRVERLRYCRNIYVNEIRQNAEYENCDLIVVADLDGINTLISGRAFKSVLSSDFIWDALAANQSGRYYDIFALRHPYWSPNNCFSQAEWLSTFVGNKRAWKRSVADRMIKISRTAAPISVDSAFGGLCLYQSWVFQHCDYTVGRLDAPDDNEHVTFHRLLKSHGGQIFIHPGLINGNRTVHSLDGSIFVRGSKGIVHKSPLKFLLPILRRLTIFVARY